MKCSVDAPWAAPLFRGVPNIRETFCGQPLCLQECPIFVKCSVDVPWAAPLFTGVPNIRECFVFADVPWAAPLLRGVPNIREMGWQDKRQQTGQ